MAALQVGCLGSSGRVMQDRTFELLYEVGRSLHPTDFRVAVAEMNGECECRG